MSPVFGHGQLRLYLLSLLADGPRHGYDVIRDLEDRSQGLYSPSAGTVYPRLAKLEEEGLVERTDEGRKAMYRITAAGMHEVQRRQGDLADLEADLDDSLRELADDLRHRLRSSAEDLRAELKEAASQARRSARMRARRKGLPAEPDNPPWVDELRDGLQEVADDLRRSARGGYTEEQVRQVRAIVADVRRQLHEVRHPDRAR
jgi:DNA-binding PadR family transcriptional regulator